MLSWVRYWRDMAKVTNAPVMCGVGTDDALVDSRQLKTFETGFERSTRTEFYAVQDAPHALELSWYSAAWYATGCAFAMQCAAEQALQEERKCRSVL